MEDLERMMKEREELYEETLHFKKRITQLIIHSYFFGMIFILTLVISYNLNVYIFVDNLPIGIDQYVSAFSILAGMILCIMAFIRIKKIVLIIKKVFNIMTDDLQMMATTLHKIRSTARVLRVSSKDDLQEAIHQMIQDMETPRDPDRGPDGNLLN